jgi:hypothetical protein
MSCAALINGRLGGEAAMARKLGLANPRALEDKDRDMPMNEIMWTERATPLPRRPRATGATTWGGRCA